nr:hypothetical protein [Tanacetum cinerariifolium]
RRKHYDDQAVGDPPGRSTYQAGLRLAQQQQIAPVGQHAERREVVGVEAGGHQQGVSHQVGMALRVFHPVHQGDGCAQ